MSRASRIGVGALAAGFALAALTGRGAMYVRPWFVPVLLVTGGVLALVAWRGGFRVAPAASAVLLIPVLVALALPPSVAGRITTSAGSATQLTSRLGDGSNPLLAGRGGPVTLLDVALAEQQVGAVYLDGREVTLEGVVDSGNRITRLVMVCCAADARPVSLSVRGTLPPKDTWVAITGRLAAQGGRLVVAAQRVARIPTPEDPFL